MPQTPVVPSAARLVRGFAGLLVAAIVLVANAPPAHAQAAPSRNLAPGFSQVDKQAKIAILPIDIELFSISAGGVIEPKADWTASAQGHMQSALQRRIEGLGLNATALAEADADPFAEQITLHAAVAQSIALHHFGVSQWELPTKERKLDWSFGDAMKPLQQRTGARYGLFVWVRDSYASAERKVAMFALALVGVGLSGGAQIGYASLVDLDDGRVLWFNRLVRGSGDLREAAPAIESVGALLAGFPTAK